MKKLVLAITLSIIALGLCSCRRDATTPADVKEELQARTVVFTASGRDYEVKSLSSGSFENGDIIGIIAPDLGKMNVKGTVSGKELIPETRIMWEPGQASKSDFYAYYPYVDGLDSSTEEFAVAADQSAEEAYKASDLCTAYVNAEPHSTVAFVMEHRFSKITFSFTSKESGETAEKLVLKGLCTEAMVDIASGAPAAGGSKTDIVAFKQPDAGFSAIVVPQPYTNVVVTTSKGREITYSTYTPVALESGCAYKANLVIPEAGHSPSEIGFTLSVIDWENGGTVSYGEPTEESL